MSYDDRMQPENVKAVAAALMNQQPGGDRSLARKGQSALHEDDGSHPDARFARGLFGESEDEVYEPSASNPVRRGLDLSPLLSTGARAPARPTVEATSVGVPRRRGLREDLVQQAAQSLCKDQIDAFLAITGKMSPDELLLSLQTARQWRRADDDWQDEFANAPETGFKFIDRKKPDAGKPKEKQKPQAKRLTSGGSQFGGPRRRNKAESLALKIAGMMREQKIEADDAPRVCRRVLREYKITMDERLFGAFANRVAQMV